MGFNKKVSVIPCVSYKTHKEMETISGCQDYFDYNLDNNRFAIADGATQSFYSSIWARLLVDYFFQNPEIYQNNWREWLKPIQEKWLEEVRQQVQKAKTDNNSVWIDNQNRLNRFESATSTFIGLQFIENQAKLSIVGDSCLFIFQGNKLIQSYLLTSSTAFGYRPEYFASYSKNNDFDPNFFDIKLEHKKSSEKLYFVLATDALAEYIFKYTEQERDILTTLLKISSEQKFEDFVTSARHDDTIKMKNDDVTLMILEISDREIVNFPNIPTKPREENQKDSHPITQPIEEYKSNTSNREENPQGNASDETSEVQSGFAKIISNLQILSHTPISLPMTRRNLTRSSSSPHQPQKDKPPVIKGINGICNLLFILFPLNLLLTAITLYYSFQAFNKINSIKFEQLSNQNLSTQANQNPQYKHKYINLEKGTKIYKDPNLQKIILSDLSNSFEVLILEEGETWLKVRVDLYAHNSIKNQCSSCASNEIEIQPKKNLRIFPSRSEGDVFGQLSESSKFEKLEFASLPHWYKFTFVGYIKK